MSADESCGDRHVSITPLRFTGISDFSDDFQKIADRAVAIASLPVKQMQNSQSDLITKKQTLTALNVNVKALADSVAALGSLGSSKALTVTSSNANKVSVTNNGLSGAATYTITEITSVAKAASETTAAGLATADSTAVDGDGMLELTLGGTNYALDLSAYGNHLNGLRDAINALGAGVTATVLNTGSGANPYYLSITASVPGQTTLQLRATAGDSGSNILTAANQGANSVFKLNGLDVVKADNVITDVVPGLTFNILDKTSVGESIILTAQSSRGSLATGLQNFVTAYNATVDKLKLQVGENAGLLSGDFIIHHLNRTLRSLTGHTGTGVVLSLVDLGIDLDKQGVMSFNQVKFYSLPTSTIDAGYEFLGSPTTGFGAHSQALSQISNPVTGLIKTQQDNYDAADARIGRQIDELVARIEQMQLSLLSKLQQADTLLNSLASQQAILEASINSVNVATFGKKDG
jgi:flagellar hook-associated protein 2